MGESGEFILSTEKIGKNIKISFADSGCGILPENMGELYKPFFSTKAKGVGLGLALSVRIVRENHRGDITVSSEPGKGSVFTVELPV
jgi:signal transduction histidine kinase